MKQAYLFLSAFLITFTLSAQEEEEWNVPEENVGMITKITATWCGPCGEWGWEAMEGALETHGEDNIVISLYAPSSSDLYNERAESLADEIGYGGTPNFAGNGIDGGTSVAAATAIVDTFVTAPVGATPAYAIYKVVQDTIWIETRTKFFMAADGVFSLNVFMVEDYVMNTQNGQEGEVPHHMVVRGGFSPMGDSTDLVVNGAVEENEMFTKKYFIEVDPEWDWENLHIMSTLWMENPEDPADLLYINGSKMWQAGELKVGYGTGGPIIYPPSEWTVGIEETQDINFDVYPNPARDMLSVQLDRVSDFNVVMVDLLGKQVYNEQFTSVNKTDINVNDLPEGVYMIQINTDTQTYTDRVVIK